MPRQAAFRLREDVATRTGGGNDDDSGAGSPANVPDIGRDADTESERRGTQRWRVPEESWTSSPASPYSSSWSPSPSSSAPSSSSSSPAFKTTAVAARGASFAPAATATEPRREEIRALPDDIWRLVLRRLPHVADTIACARACRQLNRLAREHRHPVQLSRLFPRRAITAAPTTLHDSAACQSSAPDTGKRYALERGPACPPSERCVAHALQYFHCTRAVSFRGWPWTDKMPRLASNLCQREDGGLLTRARRRLEFCGQSVNARDLRNALGACPALHELILDRCANVDDAACITLARCWQRGSRAGNDGADDCGASGGALGHVELSLCGGVTERGACALARAFADAIGAATGPRAQNHLRVRDCPGVQSLYCVCGGSESAATSANGAQSRWRQQNPQRRRQRRRRQQQQRRTHVHAATDAPTQNLPRKSTPPVRAVPSRIVVTQCMNLAEIDLELPRSGADSQCAATGALDGDSASNDPPHDPDVHTRTALSAGPVSITVSQCRRLEHVRINARHALSVDLTGCSALRHVELRCPVLHHANFSGCTSVVALGLTAASSRHLRTLSVNGCESLDTLHLVAPRLTFVDVRGTRALRTLELDCRALRHARLGKCRARRARITCRLDARLQDVRVVAYGDDGGDNDAWRETFRSADAGYRVIERRASARGARS